MSDTPRTDTEAFYAADDPDEKHVKVGFAGALERENQQLREVAAQLAGELARVQAFWKAPRGFVQRGSKLKAPMAWVNDALAAYQSLSQNAAETK